MKLDPTRLQHLRRIAGDKRATYQAALDARLEAREKMLQLQRERDQLAQVYDPRTHEKASADFAERIAAARKDMENLQERETDLAQASSTAASTFARALEFAQAEGMELPADLRPRAYGAPVRNDRLEQEGA